MSAVCASLLLLEQLCQRYAWVLYPLCYVLPDQRVGHLVGSRHGPERYTDIMGPVSPIV
jgi:hypothetical protein